MPDPRAGVVQPPRQLKGFEKLRLAPGQGARRVDFPLDDARVLLLGRGGDGWRVAPGCYRIAVGASSRDLPLEGSGRPPAGVRAGSVAASEAAIVAGPSSGRPSRCTPAAT